MISRPLCSRHLCIVTETYLPEVNGVANSLRHLISHLNPNLYRVSIVRTSPRSEFAQPDNEVWVKGVTIPQYPDLQLGLPARQRMKKLWRKDPPDAVYVATEGLLGASAVSLARELGIPVISAFHTNFHRYSGYYGLGWIRSAVMAWMRRFHNRTGATLVPSRAMVDELTSAGIERVEWLPHGVDCERFNPLHRSASLREEWGVKSGERVLLYVGRLAAEKNIRTALEAAEQAQASGAPVRVVVVGDGPLASSLKERFPEVVFTGVKTGSELSRCYASADIFMMPSQTETFGLVTLEAMAAGLPVVAYDLAAAAEFVRPGVDGVLAADESEDAFFHALKRILRMETTLMGLDARAQAEQLSWLMVARQFERRIEALIADHFKSSGLVQPLHS